MKKNVAVSEIVIYLLGHIVNVTAQEFAAFGTGLGDAAAELDCVRDTLEVGHNTPHRTFAGTLTLNVLSSVMIDATWKMCSAPRPVIA
jgi:hypothetical protein